MIYLKSFNRVMTSVIRFSRNAHILGPQATFQDYSNYIPREFRVNLASLQLYNETAQYPVPAFPFVGKMVQYSDETVSYNSPTNQLRGSTILQTEYSSVFVDPLGREVDFPSSGTTQNAGMSIDFILQRYASGQSLPVQNRNMRADSDHMSDSEMKQVRVISDVLEAQQYIRDVQAREAASKEAEADAPSTTSPASGSAGKEPSAADSTKQD